ncbi:MAG: DUF3108 domain-containing protein [Parashewanella sp.]
MNKNKIFITSLFFFVSFCFSALLSAAPLCPLVPHTAEYRVFYGDKSIDLGKARFQLQLNGDRFLYQFDSALSLLALSDKRHVTSEFSVSKHHIFPIRYFHDRTGFGSDYQEQIVYLKQQGNIISRYKGDTKKYPYAPNLFDSMSLLMQLRLDLMYGKGELKYKLLKGKKIDDYQFKVLNQNTIKLASNSYNTVKLEVVRKSKKRQTYIWLAPELGYLPIKVSHYKKGDKQLEIQLINQSFLNSTVHHDKTNSTLPPS